MYDLYPEWGPARNRSDNEPADALPSRRPRYWQVASAGAGGTATLAAEQRDTDLFRPDDN